MLGTYSSFTFYEIQERPAMVVNVKLQEGSVPSKWYIRQTLYCFTKLQSLIYSKESQGSTIMILIVARRALHSCNCVRSQAGWPIHFSVLILLTPSVKIQLPAL
jgi:hypothetical protein